MVTKKKIPMRMCVGCREMKTKKELVRVVRDKEGELRIDIVGKVPGRGAYVCPNKACLEKAIKSKAIERALEHQVDPALHESLMGMLREYDG